MSMTYEQINRQNLENMAQKVSERQQANLERHQKMSNAIGTAMNKEHDFSQMTATANGLLNGELNASNFEAQKAVEFSGQCRTAIKSLEKKLLNASTTAGLLAHQGKIDAYKNKAQEAEEIKSQIQLFKKFI
ncbi:hypothetical protein AJ85_18575 [Alkalihalobacillus alcalophilus ATCC 27647 = CGMCC 1.3604]|uniref:Uncharacterized protein n=1 Tax=Alkalihalobacillus alcalophilus ATCC 27647 = CGMCC 1.3604 TaxID=1218173 RepID=A0A094XH48_ALKAL|nr:hypothetical protein [Alkalihalobacillus alcalophilus]KGA98120.1 hypothetical protein BALCAV_0206235 [Alkalihalobacillus alcalophilus ATCC 27647 = CGMCC 1.3604]MED1561460.1 hypothetical protein [Alkalihalobacillus alcalophilus]THG89303.1 hypothetical protein AJ85_18575 [Alkalihalobacillus alcalophilus ATCC 27647 = CGMCC 1.3604]